MPYFWSDQYDLKLQSYGDPARADVMQVVDGSLTQRRLTALYGRAGVVTAVVGAGMIRQTRELRTAVAERRPWRQALSGT